MSPEISSGLAISVIFDRLDQYDGNRRFFVRETDDACRSLSALAEGWSEHCVTLAVPRERHVDGVLDCEIRTVEVAASLDRRDERNLLRVNFAGMDSISTFITLDLRRH